MAGFRIPGPLGLESNEPKIDNGTLARIQTPTPGPVGSSAHSRPVPAASRKELSGPIWVGRFPTSTRLEDLTPDFKSKVERFLGAIAGSGGAVTITATYRPAERAYLMHYSSKISRGEIAATAVPAMAGVDIEWVHATAAQSRQAASAMVAEYGTAFPPALVSRHTARSAIDMTVSNIVGQKIKDANGVDVEIKESKDLHRVGATYGVYKLPSDPPHWSADGH